ncbi:MAG TPA: aminotransferase class I/II-fold pyridoxal phosphate-dependent enzyme [Pilimelia sp.]|nr:aminotransferase class I/II-fold pyridoxal phosphate-dependent enzyme [Pilimelia sp.]
MSVRYQIAGTTAAAISDSVERGIRTGGLPAGAALPPVRALAGTLGVSAATVAKAYQSLRHRGVVETAGRNGTRVRPRPAVQASRTARHLPAPPGATDLSAGEPDAALLPDYGPALHRLASAAAAPTGYRDAGPMPELLTLGRARLAADGVPVDGADITVTAGALDGIERLLTAHLRPGDRVAVEDPSWANVLDLVAALGLAPVPVPMDEDGPTEAGLHRALGSDARAVVITTRAHNPTGAAVGEARAAGLRRVLTDHPDVLLIEDDHAAELSPVPLHPLAGAARSWAFVRSVSKPYGPDLRLALLAGDPATVARVVGRMRMGAGWVSTLLQRLVVELWRDDEVAAQVAAARQSYAERREALREALAARGLTAYARSGINVWLPVPDETRAVAALRDAGYAVAPGALYRLTSPPGIRLTVSPLRPADIEPLADAVARAVATPARRAFTA